MTNTKNTRFPILKGLRENGTYKVYAGAEVILVNGDTATITTDKTLTSADTGIPTTEGLFIPKGILYANLQP